MFCIDTVYSVNCCVVFHYLYVPYFMHPIVDKHLDYIQALAVINSAALNTFVHAPKYVFL